MKSPGKGRGTALQPRAVIVDDHPMMRRGLAHFLRDEAGLNICGQASDAREGLAAAIRLRPDLMIVDISLPGKNGVELIKELRTQLPGLKVLVHSMHDQQIYAERAVRAGASGYVMKQDDGTELLHAVREVLAGKTYRPPGLLKSPHSPRESASPARPSLLTDRELEVFSLIGKGNDNASIAHLLNLSIKTVDAHRERIKRKLRFKTSTALNLFAVRWVEADHSCENVYSTAQHGSDAEGETADPENRRRTSRRESARNRPGVR